MTARNVIEMVQRAQVNNRALGLTGFIAFSPKYFLQILEGDATSVNKLYHQKIAQDERHYDPQILLVRDVQVRDFGEWSMGYMSGIDKKAELYQRFGGTTAFDPYQLRGDAALQFLHAAAELERSASAA